MFQILYLISDYLVLIFGSRKLALDVRDRKWPYQEGGRLVELCLSSLRDLAFLIQLL